MLDMLRWSRVSLCISQGYLVPMGMSQNDIRRAGIVKPAQRKLDARHTEPIPKGSPRHRGSGEPKTLNTVRQTGRASTRIPKTTVGKIFQKPLPCGLNTGPGKNKLNPIGWAGKICSGLQKPTILRRKKALRQGLHGRWIISCLSPGKTFAGFMCLGIFKLFRGRLTARKATTLTAKWKEFTDGR